MPTVALGPHGPWLHLPADTPPAEAEAIVEYHRAWLRGEKPPPPPVVQSNKAPANER